MNTTRTIVILACLVGVLISVTESSPLDSSSHVKACDEVCVKNGDVFTCCKEHGFAAGLCFGDIDTHDNDQAFCLRETD